MSLWNKWHFNLFSVEDRQIGQLTHHWTVKHLINHCGKVVPFPSSTVSSYMFSYKPHNEKHLTHITFKQESHTVIKYIIYLVKMGCFRNSTPRSLFYINSVTSLIGKRKNLPIFFIKSFTINSTMEKSNQRGIIWMVTLWYFLHDCNVVVTNISCNIRLRLFHYR